MDMSFWHSAFMMQSERRSRDEFCKCKLFTVFLVVLLLLLLVQRVLPFAEIKRRIICQGILLIASYVFYGWWNMRLCLLLMGITWISFFTAVKKDEKHLRQSRISLLIGVGTPLAVLEFLNIMISL